MVVLGILVGEVESGMVVLVVQATDGIIMARGIGSLDSLALDFFSRVLDSDA